MTRNLKRIATTTLAIFMALSTVACGSAPTTAVTTEDIQPVVEKAQEVVEEVVEEVVTEETVTEVTKAVEEVVAEETAEVEEAVEAEEPEAEDNILTKYGLEITHLNGYSYEDTFLMGEFNKDENDEVIMDNYALFEAPSSACMTEIDNGDGTKTIEAYIEVVYKDWSTEYYYNHYDYVLIDLTTGDILTSKYPKIYYEGEEVKVDGKSKNEYNDDYTFGSIRLDCVVPMDYDNYALYMRDVVVRDHLLSSFFDFVNVSRDEHYVLLQN